MIGETGYDVGSLAKSLKKDFSNVVGDKWIFDFNSITNDSFEIEQEKLIQSFSINRQRFSELLKTGNCDCFSDNEHLLTELSNSLDSVLTKKIDVEDCRALAILNLVLLNFNLFYKPYGNAEKFLSNHNENEYVFRGEKDTKWSLTPSIYRYNDLYSFDNGDIDFEKIEDIYNSLELNDILYSLFPQKEYYSKYSFFQQYSALSPLLDFTYSLDIAIAYACDNYDVNGCVYALKKDFAPNNNGDKPDTICITNYDHLLTPKDIVNGKPIFYLTHCDFNFSYSLIEVQDNELARALNSCYVLINKATVVNNNLICPFEEKLFQILLVDGVEKRKQFTQRPQAMQNKAIASDIQGFFKIPQIDNYLDFKIKIAPDVVYRENEEGDVILIKNDRSKIYNLTGSVGYILNHFKNEYRSIQSLVDSIKQDFMGVTPGNLLSVKRTLEQLINDEIMIKSNELVTDFTPQVLLSKGRFYHPNELTNCAFELTYRCNEKCKYCYCVVDETQRELSLDELKNIMDQLYDMNVLELTFTGGDPFVRNDTFEVLQYACQKGFAINIFTNGTALSDEDLLTMKSLHPKTIHFSVFSHIAERHDAFTQVPGSFEKTISVAKKCILLGLPVNIKFTVTNQNMDDVDGVLSMVEKLGATIQIATEVFSKNDGDSSTLQYGCFDKEKLFEIYDLEKKHIVVKCSEGHSDLQFYNDDDRVCGAGDHAISVTPYGDVYTCNALPISIGNTRKQTVSDIWNHSEELKKIREIKWSMIEGC